MQELDTHLTGLQRKIQLLLKQHQLLFKENGALKSEIAALQAALKHKNALAETLQQQVDLLKLNNGNLDERERKEAAKKIDEYLKEIEKCLTLLHS